MKISTKGRYGLLIMLDVASGYKEDKFISLKEISEKENISLKYLEKIMLNFKNSDFFISSRGGTGGYKLKYAPKDYKIGDILRIAEGDLNVTDCVHGGCTRAHTCKTFALWRDLNKTISDFLDSKTLEDYM